MHPAQTALALLLILAPVRAVQALDMDVKLTLRSDRVGLFEFTGHLPDSALDASGRPSVASLRPLVAQAQRALARREGYLPHIYGDSSGQMTSSLSARVIEVAVTDPRSGRLIHASRRPLRPGSARSDRVRSAAPSLMRRTQIDPIDAAPAIDEAGAPGNAFGFVGPVSPRTTGRMAARSVLPFAATVGFGPPSGRPER